MDARLTGTLRSAHLRIPRIALPPSTLLVCVLSAAYALPGLFGHDPWKAEDAIGVGIVHQMVTHAQWLLPNLAGEIHTEDGPFFYWLAALLAGTLSPAVSFDDAARLASGVAVIATLFLLRATGRELYGRPAADGALLVLIGCLGLMLHAHETLGELGMLFAQVLAWYGIALAPRRPHKGAAALGMGLAAAVLSKGLAALLAPALTAATVLVLSRHWRTGRFSVSMLEAACVPAVITGAWLLLASERDPAGTAAWLAAQWQGLAWPSAGPVAYYLTGLSWAAWPAWPIALWLLWNRRNMLGEPALLFALCASIASLLVLFAQGEQREINMLGCLAPLSLFAGAGIERLRRGAAMALEWFGAMSFSFFGALVWLGWFAMTTGTPSRIARNFAKLEPGYVPRFEGLLFALALALTLAWVWVLARTERSPYRGVLFWASGATLVWGLVMTLLLPWIEYGKTYRPVAQSLSSALRAAYGGDLPCIESRNLGQAQRAAFDYHAGLVTRREKSGPSPACPALLVQASPGEQDPPLAGQWKRVWEGNRPRDRERYRLYLKTRE
ncbi:MAG: glycosyltransferase family 39 protein [Burkholderiales bacterium]|nr:glycosyltransferase family 39 protein [Burkholderiales bacterium]